jgi:hypothetical protein
MLREDLVNDDVPLHVERSLFMMCSESRLYSFFKSSNHLLIEKTKREINVSTQSIHWMVPREADRPQRGSGLVWFHRCLTY